MLTMLSSQSFYQALLDMRNKRKRDKDAVISQNAQISEGFLVKTEM